MTKLSTKWWWWLWKKTENVDCSY